MQLAINAHNTAQVHGVSTPYYVRP